MKKKYIKPESNTGDTGKGLLPIIGVCAALAGGYAIGRLVKSIELRAEDNLKVGGIKGVIVEYA